MIEFLLFLILLTLLFGASKVLKLTKWFIITIVILCFIFLSLLYTSSAYSYSINTSYLLPLMSVDGADGTHGKDGKTGKDGQHGRDGANSKTGNGGNGGNGGDAE